MNMKTLLIGMLLLSPLAHADDKLVAELYDLRIRCVEVSDLHCTSFH